MVFIDEKVNLVHAAVRKHLVSIFKEKLREGSVYSIKNLRVATNTAPYRPLTSNLKLLFMAVTVVDELKEDTVQIPRHRFQFVNQSVLQSRADDHTILSDIVGCLCGFNGVDVAGGGSKKRDIKILTDYYSVYSTITLWGKLGEAFDPSLYQADGGPYIIVLSSVAVKTYQGSISFSSTSASKIYINPKNEHVASVKERDCASSFESEAELKKFICEETFLRLTETGAGLLLKALFRSFESLEMIILLGTRLASSVLSSDVDRQWVETYSTVSCYTGENRTDMCWFEAVSTEFRGVRYCFVNSFKAPSLIICQELRDLALVPKSPYMSFPKLMSDLETYLLPSEMVLISRYHTAFRGKKITRNQLISKVRQIAGDNLLKAAIKLSRNNVLV